MMWSVALSDDNDLVYDTGMTVWPFQIMVYPRESQTERGTKDSEHTGRQPESVQVGASIILLNMYISTNINLFDKWLSMSPSKCENV